jgi:hypothetical protein
MRERLGRFVLEPFDDRDAAEAEDHHRVVRIANHAGELAFEDAIQLVDDFLFVDAGHVTSPFGSVRSAVLRERLWPSLAR